MHPSNQIRQAPESAGALELTRRQEPRARAALLRRLCEVVSWPENRMPQHERQLAADILLGLLRTASVEVRSRCAQGLIRVHEAPKALLRYLARDDFQVARELLENGVGLDDSDLIATVRAGVAQHWLAIARRRGLNEAVTDALCQTNDVAVIEALLRNNLARLSVQGVELILAKTRQAEHLAPLLTLRPEIKPTQALIMFWWVGFDVRVQIIRRFAADRSALLAELGDVFALAAAEGWADADVRKALQTIERRQRNRVAAQRSPFGSLENAITVGVERGADRALLDEIGHLAGVRPATAAQIFSDPGGEAIGVLCKATGLRRQYLLMLWRALRRPGGDPAALDNALGRTVFVYDTLATVKAQTVLRYWNWSFTADAASFADEGDDENQSQARRNAILLFQRNM